MVVPADLISATIEDKARGTAGTNWPALSFPMIFALPLLKSIRKKVFGYICTISNRMNKIGDLSF